MLMPLVFAKGRARPLKIRNIEPHVAEYQILDTTVVVSSDRNIEEQINNLELDLDVFWRKYSKKGIYHISFVSGLEFTQSLAHRDFGARPTTFT